MSPERKRYECPLCGWFSVKGRPERKLLNHMTYHHQMLRNGMGAAGFNTLGWHCWCGAGGGLDGLRPDHPGGLDLLLQHMRDVGGGVIPHVYACLLGVEHG